jgi:hypothetical protein
LKKLLEVRFGRSWGGGSVEISAAEIWVIIT